MQDSWYQEMKRADEERARIHRLSNIIGWILATVFAGIVLLALATHYSFALDLSNLIEGAV